MERANGTMPSSTNCWSQPGAELDEAKRRGMYEEMQHIIKRRWRLRDPGLRQSRRGVSDKGRPREQVSGVWELDGARCIERWWLT